MKRLSATAVVLGALAVGLTACGGDDKTTDDASGLRRNAPSITAPSATAAPPVTGAATESPEAAPTSVSRSGNTSLGPASQTTCGEFKNLDTDGEKSLMESLLAENPGSKFEGSPNVALGTAKLVCLAESQADKPVAVAIGIAEQ
ncbi:hypothetical protein [Nocardia mexicana]|uniref:DUF732 domain-containing protein n=1 Tax=Nocardia mexicana TaxID=279262 RepID=A0A370GGD7_9NOCA|nr:hypothetical protein [Nocardia mexicana]RDI42390.1 hypothetical protein DFR68_12746 [Nocardia mexicana]